ncbi:hypothetical protein MATL_G00240750 [Megalops atlanticus]|uniref:GRAM domain-containing protein n=1 Tax=Megalops atlanticus TaxID=7932 RepID=A0A9D3T1M0_MEGAT|nr:hypothetical protein MATL_G00240750 [Megalops atlanticus]
MSLQSGSFRKFSLDSCYHTVEGGGLSGRLRKGKSKERFELRKAQSLEEAQLEIQELGKSLNKQQTSLRSPTIEETVFERPEGAVSRNSFIKHNKTFHKLFRDIPESEELTYAFTCTLQKTVLYHGKLFVTENYVCFHSSALLKQTKVVIHAASVQSVKKQNTARVVPNALSIHTQEGEKFLFVSLRNREACYKLLCTICPNVEEESGQSSPVLSSAENSFDQEKDANSSHSSLEDGFDVKDPIDQLDSPLPKLTRNERPHGNSSSSIDRDPEDSSAEEQTGHSWIWAITDKVRSLLILRETSNLNLLLFIYLLLVLLLLLSSGYIGLRIVALEEQLSSMGALPEFTLQSGYKDT